MNLVKKSLITATLLSASALISAGASLAADLEPVSAPEVAAPASSSNDNFYVSLFGGANISVGDTEFSNGVNTVDTDFDTGFAFGGAIGYKWKNFSYSGITPRTEIEVNYFENEVGSLDFSGNGAGNEALIGDNNISGVGVFANLFLDWNNAFDSGITPYVGGGVGVAFVDNDLFYGPGANISNEDAAFAFNIGAGASYDLTERVSLFADARYVQIVDIEGERLTGAGAPNPGPGATSINFEDDFSTVLIRSGLSISF